MPKRVHISLIHGTFARNAGWTEETSAFCKSIVSGLDINATFSRPQWSGRNSTKDRIAAADELAASLNTARSADPDCLQIVIGHSHGGSVLAYALARHPELAETVAGAFLSTPFIDARPRRNWFLTAMIVSFGFASISNAALSALEYLFVFYMAAHGKNTTGPLWMALTLGPEFIVFLAIMYLAVFSAPKIFISSNPKRMARTISTCRLPTGTYLFVRTTGDEAGGVLSTAQFSSWVFSRLVQGATFVFPKHLRRSPIKKKVPEPNLVTQRTLHKNLSKAADRCLALTRVRIPIVLLMVVTLMAGEYLASTAVLTKVWLIVSHKLYPAEAAQPLWKVLLNLDDPANGPLQNWGALVSTLSVIFSGLVVFAAFCYLALITLSFLISWISQRAFGGASFAAVMSLEMAVEPVPIGSHTVVHATWAASYRGLTHSLVYQNPNTIAVVRTWIASIANP